MNQIDAQTVLDRPREGADAEPTAPVGLALLFAPSAVPDAAVLAAASADGFTHLLAGAPVRSASAGAFEARLSTLAGLARGHGLGLVIDVALDWLAAESVLARLPDAPFARPDLDAALDPRHRELPGRAMAAIDLDKASEPEAGTDEAVARYAGWWGERAASWRRLGVDGFSLRGLDRLPAAAARAVVAALRGAVPGALLIAWLGWDGAEAGRLDVDFVVLDCADELAMRALHARRERLPPMLGWPGETLSPSVRRRLQVAAMAGEGWLVPRRLHAREPLLTARLNTMRGQWRGRPRIVTGQGAPLLAVLRQDHELPRLASRSWLCLANQADDVSVRFDPADLLPGLPGAPGPFIPSLRPGRPVVLAPAEARLCEARHEAERVATPLDMRVAREAAAAPRLAVEQPSPYVDDGRFPTKRTVGEAVTVEADVVFDGHDQIAVSLLWREAGESSWQEARMRPLGNDRWRGAFPLSRAGLHEFQVEAWMDRFETWRDEVGKKHQAGVPIDLELREGVILVRRAAKRTGEARLVAIADAAEAAEAAIGEAAGRDEALRLMLGAELESLMRAADDRPFAARLERPGLVDAERLEAGFSAWYEVFPRSLSDDVNRHGTFADVRRHLPRVRAMGFDVLYFPPIHPIGQKNRKGRNNSLNPAPDDPGSPYAIGSAVGGHDALHPELGTLEDFRAMVDAAAREGIEIAIDFAVQCSPDHPWLREHAGWFDWRPDGSIRYAENPPKKYQDIVNVDFYAEDAVPSLWMALCDVVLFWASQGVRLFRVDNPHTKPFPFWEWLIREVRARYPDSVFLAEAFTRPKIMARLAKIGFSQSYTYFTWRHGRAELREYLEELADGPGADFYRPHFFVNTPDINPVFLQSAGRPGHLIRACLAATLSGLWGVYNGFELCEATPLPGREEYLDSEKYQLRAWDWNRPGNIVGEITRLNEIRHDNPALRSHKGVRFLDAGDDAVLAYEKASSDRSNLLLVVVSLDPFGAHLASVELPVLAGGGGFIAEDLLGGGRAVWQGGRRDVALTQEAPYRIYRIAPNV